MAVTIKDVAAAAGVSPSTVSRTCKDSPSISRDTKERVRRIMARDGIPEDYARLRVSAQKPSAWFQAHCDYTIESTEADTVETTGARAKALFEKILEVNQTMEENKKTPAPTPEKKKKPAGQGNFFFFL